MRRRRWAPLIVALGVVALVIAWQAWEEWRVRRRLDEALATLAPFVDGPVETWFARLPEPRPSNEWLRQLERETRTTLVDLTEDHVRGAALDAHYGNGWKTELRQYLEEELAREAIDRRPSGITPPGWLDMRRIAYFIPASPLLQWPAQRQLSKPSRSPLPWMWLTDLMLADALMRHDAGDAEDAWWSACAAWRLADVMRDREDVGSQVVAIREAGRCAVVARRLEQPDPESHARLQIDQFRMALRHATLVECFEWHAAARARELPPAWSPPPTTGGLLAKLPRASPNSRADRLAVADAIEATVPFLRALDDPARCGPATIPRAPVRLPGGGVAALGDATTFMDPLVLERLDRLRVQFELTRRVLDLRERRAADPAGRWSVTLGEEESECPGVRFVTSEPTPGIVVIEAVSPPGDAWLERYPAVFMLPLRVELVQPPP